MVSGEAGGAGEQRCRGDSFAPPLPPSPTPPLPHSPLPTPYSPFPPPPLPTFAKRLSLC
ncbi:MAG: hypothetical protein DSM106950_18990 [Stigonema ocellatum SAG 48.90 = DSM 106950]|nr:hypothetical protein [Stigonema ocellatum SAG 48.90 = DSM 106950]